MLSNSRFQLSSTLGRVPKGLSSFQVHIIFRLNLFPIFETFLKSRKKVYDLLYGLKDID
jgi:hypothetical protein